ncbi:MAG: C40 family peptidase [Oscillospiraceae bacterium]|nr:C40 family peptidase [Oscillospiraceae bacterium]
MKKRIASFFLLILSLYIGFTGCTAALANENKNQAQNAFLQSKTQAVFVSTASNQVQTIISTAKSLVGSSQYNGYCQRFVRICYESAGIYANKSAFTALEAWSMWKVSASRSNIPVGACIYFQGYGYDWTNGHVAIYLGDDYVIDATYQGVAVRKITNWQGYLGWGYQAGITPTGAQKAAATAPSLRKPGDGNADGAVRADDARRCLRISAKIDAVQQKDFTYYDVDKNGTITANDARLILRASAGLITLW